VRRFIVSIFLASLALAAGCGGGSSSSSTSTSTSSPSSSSPSGSNVLSISVNGGPTANEPGGSIYENAAFASATICAPGSTTNCVTVDNLLVDTGSTGLRVLASAVASLTLPTVNASNGSAAYDCVSFVDGSYLWGPVQQADVSLGGETASALPIQVISSSTSGIPTSCSNGSTLNENTVASLGANGILGVGSERTDCFLDGASVCSPGEGLSSPPFPAYYTCSGSSCSPAFISTADQVTNPVVLFPTDNNGVIVELPSVSGSASTCAGPGSFIDSGSNGLFFPNTANIPACSANTPVGDLSSFYCPTSTESFSATNSGANGTSMTTSFSVANAETLFTATSTSSDAALSGLAGLNPTGVGFDWGLPFFYGVNVYSSIDGQTMPSGEPAAPWWAY
jgi:hypothetical protein